MRRHGGTVARAADADASAASWFGLISGLWITSRGCRPRLVAWPHDVTGSTPSAAATCSVAWPAASHRPTTASRTCSAGWRATTGSSSTRRRPTIPTANPCRPSPPSAGWPTTRCTRRTSTPSSSPGGARVEFLPCTETPIRPLIDDLDFIEDKAQWGYRFRFGVFKIDEHDFERHPRRDDRGEPPTGATAGEVSNTEAAPDQVACGASRFTGVLHPREVPLGGPRAIRVRRTLPQRERSLIGAWCFVDHYGPHDVGSRSGMDVPPHPAHRTADGQLAVQRRDRAPGQRGRARHGPPR